MKHVKQTCLLNETFQQNKLIVLTFEAADAQ